MLAIKEFFKTRPNFYSVHNDSLYLICIIRDFLNDGYQVRINKYYIVKEDFDLYKKIIFGKKIDRKTRIPRVGCFQQVIETKKFKKIFGIDFDLSTRQQVQEELIDELNKRLSSTAIYYEADRYLRNDDFEGYSELNKLLGKVITPTNQITLNFRIPSLKNGEKKKIKLFNVWQANCSAVYYGSKAGVVFDLGNKNGKNREPITMLTKKLVNKSDGDVLFVISHFHDDHVNLANHIPYERLNNALFVFPFTEKPNTICFKARLMILSAYRYKIPMLFLINSGPTPVKIGEIDLYKGSTISHLSTNEAMNAEGIISFFELDKKRILVPGDSLYEFWPKLFSPTHLIAPHHGCEYRKSLNNLDLKRIKGVFVSSKYNRKYHHPNLVHLKIFKKARVLLFSYRTQEGRNRVFDGNITARDGLVTKNIIFLNGKKHINW